MDGGPPDIIAIKHDEYHTQHVGRTDDGRQFLLVAPFVPADGVNPATGREFFALYVFDPAGRLRSVTIDDLGPRAALDRAALRHRRHALLASLGPVTYQRIEVAPFRVEMFGLEFGLIAHPPEGPDELWSVTAEPGNFLCFYPPWTSGEYCT